MKDETKELLWFIGIALAAFVVIIAALLAGKYYKCTSQWARSGMATDWGPIQDCVIQHNGKWIPADNYREMR